MPSFYTPELLPTDKTFTIGDEEFHHIGNVFRHNQGDVITLNNGKGMLAAAEISSLGKKELTVAIHNRTYTEKPKTELFLLFSLLKNKNDHLLIEKCTELGVSGFYPFLSARTVRTGGKHVTGKFHKISIAAIKQCDNPYLPICAEPQELEQLLPQLRQTCQQELLLLAAAEKDTLLPVNQALIGKAPARIGIIIGPEGGFSNSELEMFTELDIPLVTLGKLILRAETAAICAVSQLQLLLNS